MAVPLRKALTLEGKKKVQQAMARATEARQARLAETRGIGAVADDAVDAASPSAIRHRQTLQVAPENRALCVSPRGDWGGADSIAATICQLLKNLVSDDLQPHRVAAWR